MITKLIALSVTIAALTGCGAAIDPTPGQPDPGSPATTPAPVATPAPEATVAASARAIDEKVVRIKIDREVLGAAVEPYAACSWGNSQVTYERGTHRVSMTSCTRDNGVSALHTTERALTPAEGARLEAFLATVTYVLTDACDGNDGQLNVMTSSDALGVSREFFQDNLNCPTGKRNVAKKVSELNEMLRAFLAP